MDGVGEMSADQRRVEERLTTIQVEVASGFAAITARLDASKDHEPRIRSLEQNQITREDVARMLAEAIAAARRPRWQDVAALIAAIATSTGLVLMVAKALGANV